MADELDDFLRRIGRVPLLTAEQERRLGRRVQRGDLAARERMVEANLRLVVHLARGLRRAGGPLALADLIQEGTIGLVRAVERFDPARGFRFSTYASWWIRQAMLHARAEHRDGLRLSGPAVRRGRELRAAREELGPAATRADLAARLGWSEDEVAALERASAGVVSLDVAGETAAPACDPAVEGERREDVFRLLAALDARSREVIELRFGLAGTPPLTAREVAVRLGTSASRVRHAEERALRRLRALPGAAELSDAA